MQERSDDFTGFRNALLAQHRERQLSLKRAVDEDLADIITARRLEVERIVHRLHRSAANRLQEGLLANRRQANRHLRTCRNLLQRDFLERLEKIVVSRLAAFRSSEGYRDVMHALAFEAQQGFSSPPVALVEKGDAVFLSGCQGIRSVREELKDVWGGLVLIEAEKEEGRLVDNTFRTRWRRLYPSFLQDIHELLASILDLSCAGL